MAHQKLKNKIDSFIYIVCSSNNDWTERASAGIYNARSKTLFFSSARLENIEAASKKGGVILNTTSNEIFVKVTVSTFELKNGLMQEHFNETYMESVKYPIAQFAGKINEVIHYGIQSQYPVPVTGILTMHRVAVLRTISGTLIITSSGIHSTSYFMVPVSEYKIYIPNDKISNIS